MLDIRQLPPGANPHDLGRGPWVVAVTWFFLILAMIATLLWFYSRKKHNVPPGWEPWLMVAAVICQLVAQIIITYSLSIGMGKRDRDITLEHHIQILKWNWIQTPFGVAASTLARLSITILLIRLFGVHRWFKIFLIVLAVIQTVGAIVFLAITFSQARPIEALWDVFITDAKRLNPKVWLYMAYLYQSFNSFSDLIYVLLPVIFVWRLNMALRNRVGLILLLCGSIFTVGMSVTKTVFVSNASKSTKNSVDVEYNSMVGLLCTVIEPCVIIIMGTIPSLRSLAKWEYFPRLSMMGHSLNSLLRKPKSKISSLQDTKDPAASDWSETGTAYVLPESRSKFNSSTVQYQPQSGSFDDLLPGEKNIKRTDQVELSYRVK